MSFSQRTAVLDWAKREQKRVFDERLDASRA